MPGNLLNRRAFVAALASDTRAAAFLARQEPTFSTDVKVVNVFATVRDKKGQIVKDLKKEDFSLVEDGRPQVIKYFSQQSDLPLTLGLLVDTSRSERRMIPTERTASHKFFEQVLRPDRDKAFLLHFDREVELLQDLTASRERLEKALDLLDAADEQQQTDSGGIRRAAGVVGAVAAVAWAIRDGAVAAIRVGAADAVVGSVTVGAALHSMMASIWLLMKL